MLKVTILHKAMKRLNIYIKRVKENIGYAYNKLNSHLILVRYSGSSFSSHHGLFTKTYLFLKELSFKFQTFYNIIMDSLLTNKMTSVPTLIWIRFLFLFHDSYMNLHIRFGDNNVNLAALSISMITARLHLGGWLIVVCLIILRLQGSFRKVARYYQADMTRLNRDFPHIRMEKRYMKRATEAIVEALENPKTQAVAIAVAGALAWKAMDLWDTTKNEALSEATNLSNERIAAEDRAAEAAQRDRDRDTARETAAQDRESTERTANRELDIAKETADKDRATAKETADRDRDAENTRHRESLAAEATQRQLDREANKNN